MERTRVVLVDAFASQPLAGTAAGVVPAADDLEDEQRQAIARELAVSETAFVSASDRADYRLRYHTPTQEIDCSGHASIATFVHLAEDGVIDPGTLSIQTNGGVLEVTVEADGSVWMSQDDPTVIEVDVEYERLADALGVDELALSDLEADLPVAVASTGISYLIVPVAYLEHVGGATPDQTAIEELSDEFDVTGVYLFTFDALSAESTVHGRMFAPRVGIAEDPVTGTASGAVGAYLRRFGAIVDTDDPTAMAAVAGPEGVSLATDGDHEPTAPDELQCEQGHFVNRPGTVRVRIDGPIRIGGRGIVSLDGSIVVPEPDRDDILEV